MGVWPRRDYDPEAMDRVLAANGMTRRDLERQTRMKPGRLDSLAMNGWEPLLWEFYRMSVVLDMDMEDLYDEVCLEREPAYATYSEEG